MRARLLARLAAELTHAADRSRSQDLSREAVALAERLGDVRTLGYVLARRHTVLTDPGDAVERRALASTIVELGHRTADRELEAEGRGWRLFAQLELGDIGGVESDLEALGRLAGATRHPRYLWLAAMFRAMRALLAARIDDAERPMHDAFALGQRHGDPNASLAYGAQLFMVRRAEGRLDEIAQLMHEVMGGHAADPTWESGMALLHVMLGQLEPARARFVPAYETFLRLPRDDTWLLHLCVLGKTCAALGDRERAHELLTRLRPYADRFVVAPPGAVCHGAAARVAGLLAATLERWEESLAYLEQAARLNERIGALGWLAETASNQATVLLARDAPGDREAARGHLVRARVLASRLGLRDVTAKVEQIAARLQDRDGEERPGALRQVFRRDGDDWRVEFGGRVCSLHDSKGVGLLVELLRRPGSPCHAAVLVAAVEGVNPAPDPGTLSTAESERHRVSVTRTVHAVLDRLARSHPALGEHLARTVRTGTWCAYDPDPRVPTTWEL
jgi:tetratricopeptide (TPR) repeat protein